MFTRKQRSHFSNPVIIRTVLPLGNSTKIVDCGAKHQFQHLQRKYGNRTVRRMVVQSSEGGGKCIVGSKIEQAVRRKCGGGQALDRTMRRQMEPVMNADFGGVRVHTDTESDRLNKKLNATAFTAGSDIFFRQGAYQPGSSLGRTLLAHELTHVIQQNDPCRADSTLERSGRKAGQVLTTPQGRVPKQLFTKVVIQRKKIPYGTLAWTDFKAKVPKSAKYDALTISDFHDPKLGSLGPKTLSATEGVEVCKIGKQSLKRFSVNIAIDPTKIIIAPYMFQEKSWVKSWAHDLKARKRTCKTGPVKKCLAHFKKSYLKVLIERNKAIKKCKKSYRERLKKAKKTCDGWRKKCQADYNKVFKSYKSSCKSLVGDCYEKLSGGAKEYSTTIAGTVVKISNKRHCKKQLPGKCALANMKGWSYSFSFGKKNIKAVDKKECQSVLVEPCKNEIMKNWQHEIEFSKTKKAKANTLAQCSKEFSEAYMKLAMERVRYSTESAGETITAKKKSDCDKSFFNDCVDKLYAKTSSALLEHEQHHFDITFVSAMQAQNALQAMAAGFPKKVIACGSKGALKEARKQLKIHIQKLKSLFSKEKKKRKKRDKQYDKETDHGNNLIKQQKWSTKVSKELKKIKPKP